LPERKKCKPIALGNCFPINPFSETLSGGIMFPKVLNSGSKQGAWSHVLQRSQTGLFLMFLFFLLGTGNRVSSAAVPAEFRSDQILVQPGKNVNPGALARFHAARRVEVLKTFEHAGRVQLLRVPANESVPGLISKYQQSGLVEFAEPDYLVHASAAPNDPMYVDGTLWWLNNTGQDGGTSDADIDAPEAWDVLNSASNIVVAVLDTGIRYTHEDLAGNMWVNPVDGGHGFNAFTGTNDVADDNGHGTLVAGVLGATGNNRKGMAGVAWRVQMMACKCLDSTASGSDSTVIACIDYARMNGARVINASFDSSGSSLAVSNAIVAARDAGIIFVASCGNGTKSFPNLNVDLSPRYPACYPMDNIISVAYTGRNDELGTYSYYGPTTVDLGAPGDQVSSTFTNLDNGYLISSANNGIAGTSFAAPLVSGACALMLAKYPAENYRQIIARILKATDPLPSLAGKCVTGGRLNLWKALSPPLNLVAVPGTNGAPVQLHLSTGANRICIIEYSPDLFSWHPLFTNITALDGTFDFADSDSASAPQRFYRAVSTP
jgi:subtilisin family serine protease